MKNRQLRNRARFATKEDKEKAAREIEMDYPGYLAENEKLTTMIWIFTGLRVLYALFYLYVSLIYGLSAEAGIIALIGTVFFFGWYSFMIRADKWIALLLLLFKGYSIVLGGATLLTGLEWLPWPLIFTLIFSFILEFIEAVFCIYALFNPTAAQTVRLNRNMDRGLLSNQVSRETVEKMADYKNPYEEENDREEENTEEENT